MIGLDSFLLLSLDHLPFESFGFFVSTLVAKDLQLSLEVQDLTRIVNFLLRLLGLDLLAEQLKLILLTLFQLQLKK